MYADLTSKINRCRQKADENENLSDKEIEQKIIQIDKNRKKYHNILSNLEWGDKRNYHLCINTSGIETKTMILPLTEYIENWFRRREK